jgi:hypothetical protein
MRPYQIPSTNHHIDGTLSIWQRRKGQVLSREDARQITENIAGFFELLAMWSRAELADSKQQSKASSITEESDRER